MHTSAWAALFLVLAATAAEPAEPVSPAAVADSERAAATPVPAVDSAPDASPVVDPAPADEPPPQPDAELARLSYGLDALLEGSLPTDITVAELLGGTVPSADSIEQRLEILEHALARPPTEGATPQELVDTRVRRSVLERQRDYLRKLARTYERMPRPALRALELLTRPRTPIRAQATAVADLETATTELLDRLQTLDDLLAAGRLVGFRSEQEPARRRLEAAANQLASLRGQTGDIRIELDSLATTQETTGRATREKVLRAVATDALESTCDLLYQQHRREQRRLRKAVTSSGASHETIAQLAARARATLPQPTNLGDIYAAEQSLVAVQAVSAELITLLGDLRAATSSWALAFERELVTLLEPLTSEETRAQAQRITFDIVEEIRVEAVDGWDRVVAGARSYPGQVRSFLTDWRAHGVQIVTVLVLVVLALLFGTRRIAPMRWLVRRLARWPWLRRHVGLVVRSGNLLQTVFPSLAVYGLLYVTLDVIGFERPGVQLTWVFVHWIGLFWIGRQLVQGATRPVARGRPALITASPATAQLVRVTYSRLGLIFAVSFIVDEIAANWFGAGHLRALIDLVVIVWIGAWALWAAFAWRERLARAWAEIATKGTRARAFADWMQRHRLGALFSLVALARLALHRTLRASWWLLERTGVNTYLRAKSLHRLSREGSPDSHATPGKLPEEYLREFPLSPLVGENIALAINRPAVDAVAAHLESWQQTHANGSVVLLGENGAGKTTLLAQVAGRVDREVTLHRWSRKATREEQVVRELGPLFGHPEVRDVNALIAVVRDGPEHIVLLDEVHDVFLRTIDGYRGLDALVDLVNGTHDHVFWVLAFNTFAWEFLNQSRGRAHHFRRLVWLDRWSVDELKRFIDEHNKNSGFTVEFDPVILDADADTRDFQLVESADGFFRLLWETSGGNPRVGLFLWLQSLQMQFGSIRAKLFRQPSLEDVDGLTDDMVFVLASICQHENLSVDDLGVVLRMKPGRARFAMQFLREAGIIESKQDGGDSFSLAPRYYRQTLRFLRSQHLLFEAS